MTYGRFLLSHVGRMAILTLAAFLELRQLTFDRHDRLVGNSFVVVVTGRATDDRHIRSKTAQCAGPGDIDVTGRAFNRMIATLAAAFMVELGRLSHRHIARDERGRRFMTTAAIVAGRLLVFPVAVEARVVTVGHRLEKYVRLGPGVRQRRARRDKQVVISLMTDGTVVVIRSLLIVGS